MNTSQQPDPERSGAPGTAPTPIPISTRPPVWVWIASASALVLALMVVVVIWPSSSPPAVAKEMADQVEGWDGIEYRGQIADPNGGQMDMVVVVDRDGNAGGTLSQGTGGRAEFRTVGAASYLKGDRAWWQRAEPRYVDKLADIWLSDTGGAIPYPVTATAKVNAKALAGDLRNSTFWKEESAEEIGGVDARTLSNFATRIQVTDDRPLRLLAVKTSTLGRDTMVQVRPTGPGEAPAVVGLPPEAQGAPTKTKKMFERASVYASVQLPVGLCESPTCSATVNLRNSGDITGTGTVDVTMNGRPAGSFPYSVGPGQTSTFEVSAPNPAFERGLRGGSMYWYARTRE